MALRGGKIAIKFNGLYGTKRQGLLRREVPSGLEENPFGVQEERTTPQKRENVHL